jgi:hypothetical protein
VRYRTLLALHGMTALALATGLALYVASGWMILHNAGITPPRRESQLVPVAPVGGATEHRARVEARAAAAAERAGLEGAAARRARFRNGEWKVLVSRAAQAAEVRLAPGATEARVERRHPTLTSGLTNLHHMNAGDAHGAELAWVVGIDALAVALLVFAWSGVAMFLRLKRDRRFGWLLLGASALYTVAGIVWLAFLA